MEDVVEVVRALHDYDASDATCLSFRANDILFVHMKDPSGWWDATLNGQRGWFPSNFSLSIPADEAAKYKQLYISSNGKLFQHRDLSPTSASTAATATATTAVQHTIVNPNLAAVSGTASMLPTPVSAQGSEKGKATEQTLSLLMEQARAFENDISSTRSPASDASSHPSNAVMHRVPTTSGHIATPNATTTASSNSATTTTPARTPASSSDASTQRLAPFWGRKLNQQGVVYYYNTRTNETTYNIEDALHTVQPIDKASSPNRSSIMSSGSLARSRISTSMMGDWSAATSLMRDKQAPTWEIVVNNILLAVSSLNQATKTNSREKYVKCSTDIIHAVRDMLVATGCTSSQTLSSPVLKKRYSQVMSTICKLSLAAKVSAGIWPPPDSIVKMRHQAGQVLMAVKVFVSSAQEEGIKLQHVTNSAPLETFSTLGAVLTDHEFSSKFDKHHEQIAGSISNLVKAFREDRSLSENVINATKESVTNIGQFLSFVEEVQAAFMGGDAAEVEDFQQKKDSLYTTVNNLLSTALNGIQNYQQKDACNGLVDNIDATFNAAEGLLLCMKCIIDKKETEEQESLQKAAQRYEVDTRHSVVLSTLQRKAMGLKFVSSDERRSVSGNDNSPVHDGSPTANSLASVPTLSGSPAATYQMGRSFDHQPSSLEGISSKDFELGKLSLSESQRKSNILHRPTRVPTFAMNGNTTAQPLEKSPLSASTPAPSTPSHPRPTDNGNVDVSQTLWFLGHDYAPDDITFNAEGKINGGTFLALVERLTMHDQPAEPLFTNAFMVLFHQFAKPEDFAAALIKRYQIRPPPELTEGELKVWREQKLVPIRLRVYNVFRSWLENYWQEGTDLDVLKEVERFAKTDLMESNRPLATRLLDLVRKKLSATDFASLQRIPKKLTGDIPQSILPKNLTNIKLLDLHPLEVARQLTLMESKIFNCIKVNELIGQQWSKKKDPSCAWNVRCMTNMSNNVTGWVISSIVMESDIKKRAAVLKHFIKIGDRCLQLNNMNTLMAISTALNSSTITRLKKTFELLNQKTLAILDTIVKATDHSRNYAEMRSYLKGVNPPALPFLGLFLTDLTFTEEGNPTMRNAEKNIVNMDKFIKIWCIINQLQRFQVPYVLYDVEDLQSWLISEIHRNSASPEQLYQLSLQIEPRQDEGYDSQRDMDQKIRSIESNLK